MTKCRTSCTFIDMTSALADRLCSDDFVTSLARAQLGHTLVEALGDAVSPTPAQLPRRAAFGSAGNATPGGRP
jgi:hypothetical protein